MNIKNKSKLSCTIFLAKYCSLYLYYEDLEKIFIIDHGQLKLDKNAGCTLIGIPEKLDGNMSNPEYFCINDDQFDIF